MWSSTLCSPLLHFRISMPLEKKCCCISQYITWLYSHETLPWRLVFIRRDHLYNRKQITTKTRKKSPNKWKKDRKNISTCQHWQLSGPSRKRSKREKEKKMSSFQIHTKITSKRRREKVVLPISFFLSLFHFHFPSQQIIWRKHDHRHHHNGKFHFHVIP